MASTSSVHLRAISFCPGSVPRCPFLARAVYPLGWVFNEALAWIDQIVQAVPDSPMIGGWVRDAVTAME